jgi:hypothetical protein
MKAHLPEPVAQLHLFSNLGKTAAEGLKKSISLRNDIIRQLIILKVPLSSCGKTNMLIILAPVISAEIIVPEPIYPGGHIGRLFNSSIRF